MVTFNILGDCVSRDIFGSLVQEGNAEIRQYVSFSSPISICSDKANFQINMEKLSTCSGADFVKRCMCLDVNKQTFDYLFEQDSNYLVLDILDARANMLRNGKHYITVLNMVSQNREFLIKNLDLINMRMFLHMILQKKSGMMLLII